MTETLFYHLERRSLEEILPGLVEKSLQRGWRVAIKTDSRERSDALVYLLCTYVDESSLPHAQLGDGDAAVQPVLITVEAGNPNAAQIFFYVGGAQPADWQALGDLARIVLLFDGRDADSLAGARAAWKAAQAAGHEVTYWKETPSGKFEKQN